MKNYLLGIVIAGLMLSGMPMQGKTGRPMYYHYRYREQWKPRWRLYKKCILHRCNDVEKAQVRADLKDAGKMAGGLLLMAAAVIGLSLGRPGVGVNVDDVLLTWINNRQDDKVFNYLTRGNMNALVEVHNLEKLRKAEEQAKAKFGEIGEKSAAYWAVFNLLQAKETQEKSGLATKTPAIYGSLDEPSK